MRGRSIVIAAALGALGASGAPARAGRLSLSSGQVTLDVPKGWSRSAVSEPPGDADAVTTDRLVKGDATIRVAIVSGDPVFALRVERGAHTVESSSDVRPQRIGAASGLFQELHTADETIETWATPTCDGTVTIAIEWTSQVGGDVVDEARAILASARVAARVPSAFARDPESDRVLATLDEHARALVLEIMTTSCRREPLPAARWSAQVWFEVQEVRVSRAAITAAIARAGGVSSYLAPGEGRWRLYSFEHGWQIALQRESTIGLPGGLMLERRDGQWRITVVTTATDPP